MQIIKTLLFGIGMIALVIAGTMMIKGYNRDLPNSVVADQEIEQVAPLQPFLKGTIATIEAAHNGQAYVVAFWSISCSHCIREMTTWRKMRAANYPAFTSTTKKDNAPCI